MTLEGWSRTCGNIFINIFLLSVFICTSTYFHDHLGINVLDFLTCSTVKLLKSFLSFKWSFKRSFLCVELEADRMCCFHISSLFDTGLLWMVGFEMDCGLAPGLCLNDFPHLPFFFALYFKQFKFLVPEPVEWLLYMANVCEVWSSMTSSKCTFKP